jgi:hypothetical protein
LFLYPDSTVSDVAKIDVEAVGAMLEALSEPRSRYEDLEPEYEYLEPEAYCTCSCH